jgi:hypothetical protein
MEWRRSGTGRYLLLGLVGLLAGGCDGVAAAAQPGNSAAAQRAEPSRSPRYRDVLIQGVPHIRQKPDFCGEACAAMALQRLGHPYTQDQVFTATEVNPAKGRGAIARELVRGLKRIGFEVGSVWHTIRRARAKSQLDEQFRRLHADLTAGVPSIVCTRYDESPNTTEHFRLVIGYDARTDQVVYNEPAQSNGSYRRMRRRRLLSLWPLKYRPNRWTLVRIPLRPGRIGKPIRHPAGHSPADYAQRVIKLKQTIRTKRLRGAFKFVIQPPFVVLGDEGLGVVKRRARRTVKWAVDLLKQDYFPKDPTRVIDIWLFKDRTSYLTNTVRLTGGRPGTPFGFYSSDLDALIMNVSTGGGTLVHEIVHPYVEANFPGCPPWFNEGLASLYEAVGQRNGQLHGFTNWRLPGLQRAIRAAAVPSFKWLASRTSTQFYGEDPGTNYSQSRYLLYYLQERGLLRTFYGALVKNRARDPSGYQTLKQVLGESDMDAFKRRWQAFVLGLRWRGR